jgi:hypothetical protein
LLPYEYKLPFDEEKSRIIALILSWGQTGCQNELDLDQFESLVAIKGVDRSITIENASFRRYIMQGKSAVGKTLDELLIRELAATSQKTDAMVLDGVSVLELDHLAVWDNGRHCTMTTFKRRLDELGSNQYKILLISRFKEFVGPNLSDSKRSLGDSLLVLQNLDSIDQKICQGIVEGDATRDIANRVGLTSRSVELRRQKILDAFGFIRPIEIVKLIVRLEENGLLDGWC